MRPLTISKLVLALAIGRFGSFDVTADEPALGSFDQAVVSLCEHTRGGVVRVKAVVPEENTTGDSGSHSGRLLAGTGFFVDTNGTLLTAASVVAGAQKIVVESAGGRYEARLVGLDRERSNVAMLQLNGVPANAKFTALPLADDADLRVGSVVVLIGYPYDMPASPSLGLIGGTAMYRYTPLLMTRIGISPGESGAPFLNARGQVVGMLFGGSTQQPNVTYALPAKALKRMMADFRQFGGARYGSLGLAVQQVEVLSSTNAPPQPAIRIEQVQTDSPAAHAGVRPGDILLGIGGKDVHLLPEVAEAMFYLRAGDQTNIRVLHANQIAQVPLQVMARTTHVIATPRVEASAAPLQLPVPVSPPVIQAVPAAAQEIK